jgi:hypothetical protein
MYHLVPGFIKIREKIVDSDMMQSGLLLVRCFPKCGNCATGGKRKDLKLYAAGKKVLKIVPQFCLLSD